MSCACDDDDDDDDDFDAKHSKSCVIHTLIENYLLRYIHTVYLILIDICLLTSPHSRPAVLRIQ